MDQALIRNFCIVAHIDHGKSTLADRILELTHAVTERQMREQYLDRMDLERERGITIKAQAVRLRYERGEQEFELNLIDTPGHVDLTYDSSYDTYRGVIAYIRVVDGELRGRQRVRLMSNGVTSEVEEVGAFTPEPIPLPTLQAGDVGFLVTGVKDVRQAKVGDTVTR